MEFRNFIGGEWRETAAASANINPSDISDVIGYAAESDAAEIDHAVGAAKAAAVSWSASTPQQRFDVLDFIGSELVARKDDLGHLLAREEGKTLAEGIAETARAGQIFKFFAGEALRGGGEAMASVRPGVGVEITRSPVGVVGLITPWNFPMAIPAWKTAPALAYGNAVVLKPAELTPGCAHALAEIIARSGLPDGVFNLVLGKGMVTGARLVEHRDTDAISFTGSAETGSEIAATCGRLRKKLQMEMGGKNPMVVLDDADLDLAVEACLNGAFYSTGQRCTASSRLIVAGGIHDRFVASLTGRIAALRVGNALDRATEIGPVVDGRQLDKDLIYLDIAAKEGGQVFGGQTLQRTTNGFFLAPALITETNSGMRINQEEVFGPIASVIRVEDYEEALQVANDTPFGLSAGICTGSLKHATHFKANAEAGMVMVNLPTAGVDYHVPFGGTKGSSFGGREQAAHAKEFYSKIKTSYTFA
ncbi:aldehyde dehydrogenase family protein [Phaeobacter italicus]|uniref:aldehyde dehydrogenase family protein n=1 Tax=Phaeobacter italicus TaxID=481446 RepID=UPI001C97D5C0|nr:aldehyde dehydrogenase family protein [Phaeobacter italicus]MBY6043615.1 aldehyde dehydrogenase family protein [Phaeobacter italicus]